MAKGAGIKEFWDNGMTDKPTKDLVSFARLEDKKEPKCVYKIRRRTDGLYSKGGCEPSFSKHGKTWSSLGALRGHLTLVTQGLSGYARKHGDTKALLKQFYSDCDIITFVVSLQEKVIETVV